MSLLRSAFELAGFGFYVFPLAPNGKLPLREDYGWQQMASRDPARIQEWWGGDPAFGWPQPYNIGISTSKFFDGKADVLLLVVDIDNKKKSRGDDSVLMLELQGKELPDTYTQFTPSGGRHLVYRSPTRLGNSSHRIARGIDTRAFGGILVGRGSEVDGGLYEAEFKPLAIAPAWLIAACSEVKAKDPVTASTQVVAVDVEYAERRAIEYLKAAPLAVEGSGGNHTTYGVAAHLMDLGVSEFWASQLLLDFWNERCTPPWGADELEKVVANAYRYNRNEPGALAPDFPIVAVPPKPVKFNTPIDELNAAHAFVIVKGSHYIINETVDAKGNFALEHLTELTFHRKFASRTWTTGDSKIEPITKLWMRSPKRRSYNGFCFLPGREAQNGYYNLWRGFAVQPSLRESAAAHAALENFLGHIKDNICVGEEPLYQWIMSYFAHLIQKPGQRPDTAVVLRGQMGVGKNVVVDSIGHLAGCHYKVVAHQRYLTGNFNSHLENKIMVTLDEAFWSGHKEAGSVLKALITGQTHSIERKGMEPYDIDNCLRVMILGNEDWLVPAAVDERRFAVFDVGSGRKEDRAFFNPLVAGLEAGGYKLLMQHLLDFKISVDVGKIPLTKGLLEQKHNSLDPFLSWWLQCLRDGEIEPYGWPAEITCREVREAYSHSSKDRNMHGWLANDGAIGRYLSRCSPSVARRRKMVDGDRLYTYVLPSIEIARAEWSSFIKHPVDWENL